MSPVTHFLTGWVFANCAKLARRDRAIVTLACVAPDVDGLGIIPELLTRNSSHPLLWFTLYHHSLHTLAFSLVVAAIAFALAQQRWKTGILALVSFHLQAAVGHKRGLPRKTDDLGTVDWNRRGIVLAKQLRCRIEDLERSGQIQNFRSRCHQEQHQTQ